MATVLLNHSDDLDEGSSLQLAFALFLTLVVTVTWFAVTLARARTTRQRWASAIPVAVFLLVTCLSVALYANDAGVRLATMLGRERMNEISAQAVPFTSDARDTNQCFNRLCVYEATQYPDMTVLRLSTRDDGLLESKDDTIYGLVRAAVPPAASALTANLGPGELRSIENLGDGWYFVDYNHYCC